jgi:hypothetical protein
MSVIGHKKSRAWGQKLNRSAWLMIRAFFLVRGLKLKGGVRPLQIEVR